MPELVPELDSREPVSQVLETTTVTLQAKVRTLVKSTLR